MNMFLYLFLYVSFYVNIYMILDTLISISSLLRVSKQRTLSTLKTGLDIFPALDSTFNIRRQEIYERK